MAPDLYRRARRAEAQADRAEDRRRLRLDFFRAALAEGLESLKVMHTEGASGQESVRAYADFVDALVMSLVRLNADDAENVAPLAVRCLAALPVPVQLLQQDVLRRMDVQATRCEYHFLAPFQLLPVERRTSGHEEIDLQLGRLMNQIRGPSLPHRPTQRRRINIEVRRET